MPSENIYQNSLVWSSLVELVDSCILYLTVGFILVEIDVKPI